MVSDWVQKVEERGGALVGYARVSSQGQDLGVQTAALIKAGVTARHLFEEKASGTRREGRDQLAAMLRSFRKGDFLVVTRLDRLARSTRNLLEIADTLKEIGVDLVVLEQAINTATPEGRLFFTMLGAFGEFETEIRKARQREGIDAALAKDARPQHRRQAAASLDARDRVEVAGRMNAQQSFAARGRETAAPGVVLERCRDGREARRRLLVLGVAVARRLVPRAVVVAVDREAGVASLAFRRRLLWLPIRL